MTRPRRLAAVNATDVVGWLRLMGVEEERTPIAKIPEPHLVMLSVVVLIGIAGGPGGHGSFHGA